MKNNIPKPIYLMGIKITPFEDYYHTIEAVKYIVSNRVKSFAVAINPEKVFRSKSDDEIRELLNKAEICVCDGIGVVLAVRLLLGKKVCRITGIDLFFELIQASIQYEWKVFLLGGSPETNDGVWRKLNENYPLLRIVGKQDGYFKESDEVIKKINDSGADLLFVAMGSPKQEIWINKYREHINAPFCMGVGGTFDIVNGNVKRAPILFRKTGAEWFYRLVSEPKRGRRQLALPKFVWLLLRYKLGLER